MQKHIESQKSIVGISWKFAERILAQLVSLVVSVVLARLLTPKDYSVVGLTSIFFAFCNVFVSGGFNAALIQKKEADIFDFSSVLWISLTVAVIIYLILFFCAPFIAQLYNLEILTIAIRVMGITLIINAVKSVVCAYISRRLEFKKFFYATLGGTVASAVIGIYMAKAGFGAWALIAQQMTNTTVDTIILLTITKIRFVWQVSWKRIKVLFSYGGKIFVASIISVIYDNIKPLIVGIKFSAEDLAYYTKGRTFPHVINSSLNDSIAAVLFPVMSSVQEERTLVKDITRRFMQISSYIIFPVLLGFFSVADNFIVLLLTEKWSGAAIYLKLFCISFMFNILQVGNLQAIKAIGRSDIVLRLEVIKKASYFLIIFLFVLFFNNPFWLAASEILCSLVAFYVNSFPNKTLIDYGIKQQIEDIFPSFICSLIMVVCVSSLYYLKISVLITLLLQILLGFIIYVLLSKWFMKERYGYVKHIIIKLIYRR